MDNELSRVLDQFGMWWIMDDNGNPKEVGILEYHTWRSDFEKNCRIAKDEFGGVSVSTVFLMAPTNRILTDDVNEMLFFETMVFGADEKSENCWRYATKAEAIAGHAAVVKEYKKKFKDANK